MNVKGMLGDLTTKIKSNKAINNYIDNINISKHISTQASHNLKTSQGLLVDNIEKLGDFGDEALMKNYTYALERNTRRQSGLSKMGNRGKIKTQSENMKDLMSLDYRSGARAGNPSGVLTSTQEALAEGSAYAQMAKSYFLGGNGNDLTKAQQISRFATAGVGLVGASAGVGASVRFATGGNLTTNSNGERDIMGVPFL